MSLRYLAGFITASYNPLKVPNAPTLGTVTPGNGQVTVAFTAPSNVGGGAITSYIAIVQDTSTGVAFTGTGSASPITVTGLTNGQTYNVKVAAVNTYGPGPYSAPSANFSYAPKLYAWGNNQFGQLGQNNTTYRSSPVQIGSDSNWALASPANYVNPYAIAIKTTGTVWSWGYNGDGSLGLNDGVSRSSPVQIGALTTWSSVSCGIASGAIKTDGTLWTWGFNPNGQLGQNNRVSLSSPTQVGALTNWSKITFGASASFAIKTDGTLWVWGKNDVGQLGLGNKVYRSSPTQVGSLTDWAQISCAALSVAAIKTDGTLWSWGYNAFGQLGQNNIIYRSSPVQVGALTTWSFAAMTREALVVLSTDGTLWSCGNNNYLQLGTINSGAVKRSSPVQIGAVSSWASVKGGANHYIATRTNGTLWAWGANSEGQLGNNSTANVFSPIQVGSGILWLYANGGQNNTLATSN